MIVLNLYKRYPDFYVSVDHYKTFICDLYIDMCTIFTVITVVATILFGVLLISVPSWSMDTSLNINISNHPILITSDHFKSSSSIGITLTNSSNEQKVYLYQQPLCNDAELLTITKFTNLDTKTIPPVTVKDFRAGLNYYGDDTPIYLANGSRLQYHIDIISNINNGSCLQLFLINSNDDYFTFINSTTSTTFNKYINSTSCLAIDGTNKVLIYIEMLQGDYYVAYQATGEGNITFSATISGIQVYYDTKGSPSCLLTAHNSTCVIPNIQTCIVVNSTKKNDGCLSLIPSPSSNPTAINIVEIILPVSSLSAIILVLLVTIFLGVFIYRSRKSTGIVTEHDLMLHIQL